MNMKRGPRYTEAEWRTIDDMRLYWNAMCDCDAVPIDTDDLKERMEAMGLLRWRTATRRDVEQTPFAYELGIEAGRSLYELTKKGHRLMSANQYKGLPVLTDEQMTEIAYRTQPLPIETAPTDGRRILGLDLRTGWREMWFKRDAYEGDYWMDEFDSEPEPTHWLPVPFTQYAHL